MGGKSEARAAAAAQAQAQANINQAIADIDKLQIPDIEKQKLQMQMMSEAGFLDAEELQQEGAVQVDPRLRQAQMEALSQLRERGQTGLTEEDKAVQDIMLRDVSAQEQAGQKAIMQGMAERGMLDSGAQLAAQLGSQQTAYNRAANQASQNAIAAAQARREALSQAGNMAQGMEATQFGQGQTERNYRQAINQFNLQNRQNVAEKNLGIKQQDVGLRNQEQMYNKELLQQQFQNQQGLTQMKANARLGQASNLQNQANALGQASAQKAQATQSMIGAGLGAVAGSVIPGAGTLAGAQIGAMFSDKSMKENIERPDSESIQVFLDKLKPYKYNYKNDPSQEEQMGVMAQDLEKSDLGEEFVDESQGKKYVDYGKMASTQMAAISDLHQRLKKLEGK